MNACVGAFQWCVENTELVITSAGAAGSLLAGVRDRFSTPRTVTLKLQGSLDAFRFQTGGPREAIAARIIQECVNHALSGVEVSVEIEHERPTQRRKTGR